MTLDDKKAVPLYKEPYLGGGQGQQNCNDALAHHCNFVAPPPNSYFITITLKPEWYKYKASDQYFLTKRKIKAIIVPFVNQFQLIPELTRKTNIHFHGWYIPRCENHMDYLTDRLKQIGFTDIKPIKDTELDRQRTFSYMLEDLEKTCKIIGISVPRVYYKRKSMGFVGTQPCNNSINLTGALCAPAIYGIIDMCDDNIIGTSYISIRI